MNRANDKSGLWAVGLWTFGCGPKVQTQKPKGPQPQSPSWRLGVWAVALTVLCARLSAGEGIRLEMDSEPGGATVLLNGCLAGATPLVVDGLQPGVYGLRLEKSGCQSVSRQVALDPQHGRFKETLTVLPTAVLKVEIQPEGAEVLVDGELVGNTPLTYGQLTGGPHELVIRKTNYDTYSRQIDVEPGKTLTYSGFALKDKIAAMLNDLIRAEPQRVNNYIDLGHYYFVNARMEQAAATYAKGYEMVYTPLDFNGKGYAGIGQLSDEEKALEQRLRSDDVNRFWSEMRKHRGWECKDAALFRKKLDAAIDEISQKYVTNWDWVDNTAKLILKEDPARAADIYRRHIAATPDSPHLALAYLALAEVALITKKEQALQEAFEKFYEAARSDGPQLMAAAEKLLQYKDPKSPLNPTLLAMSEKVLRRAADIHQPVLTNAQCLFDLGVVLSDEGREKDAVDCLEHSIATTHDVSVKEERQFVLAETLLRAGRTEEARGCYTKLQNSTIAKNKSRAKNALLKLATEKDKR